VTDLFSLERGDAPLMISILHLATHIPDALRDNGLSAIFTLENGFNASNGALGQNGRLFGRQAYVGLASTRYGTLTFGRQYGSDGRSVQFDHRSGKLGW
jgi:hypothetical protein